MMKYAYVGPNEILERVRNADSGLRIEVRKDLENWITSQISQSGQCDEITATFVVDLDGFLNLADRRSEHVACARGKQVLSAGEITFACEDLRVAEVSNQSTGYCPEPESWGSSPE